MRYLIFADPHWSAYSSIVRSRGKMYSTRLEYLIKTMNWIESQALSNSCDSVICLGDFFDKSELNSEEITALGEIEWSMLPHHFIVGNHEMGASDLKYSSSHLFGLCPNSTVEDKPSVIYEDSGTKVVALPYVLESIREPLSTYFPATDKKLIILSHNDIKGIQMGKFVSTDGFELKDIVDLCSVFINGHLHNATSFDNVINLGSITGQNFSEDAFRYRHSAMILDTEDCSIDFIENPYALNFYKIDLTTHTGTVQGVLSKLGPNAVCSIKATPEQRNEVDSYISSNSNIVECRLILDMRNVPSDTANVSYADTNKVDHIAKFADYVRETFADADFVEDELLRLIQ